MKMKVQTSLAVVCVCLLGLGLGGNSFGSWLVTASSSNPTVVSSASIGGDYGNGQFASNLGAPPPAQCAFQVLNITNWSYTQRLCALTLQGIVNRDSMNMIYLVSWKVYEPEWLPFYQNNFNFSLQYYYDLASLIRADKNSIRGYVVYDPTVPASQFIAATICGLNSSIAVSPDMIDMVKNLGIVQDTDLRGNFMPGNTTAVYEWGFHNLYPLCNHTIIGNMPYNNIDDGYVDVYMQIIDYLVSKKAFVMGLSSSTEPDHTLKQMFLDKMDKFGWVLGWYGPNDFEYAHVMQVTTSGLTVVGSFPESPNYSVHCRFTSGVYKQKTVGSNPVYDKNKIYVTFIVSDGDGLWTADMRYRNNWESPLRGQIKMGWELGLAFNNICPDILDYFYATQSPSDEFVGSAGGVGYFFPDLISQDELRQRLTLADSAMRDLDMKSLFLMTHVWPSSEELKQTYDATVSATGFFEGYEGKQLPHEVLNNSVWFETDLPNMPIDWYGPWQDMEAEIQSIAQSQQFIVIHVMPIENVMEKVYDIAANLGSNYEVVLPSELASLKLQSVRLPVSALGNLVLGAGENQACFLYADPQRMTRVAATYDLSSGGIVYGMCNNSQVQNFDTDPVLVSQNQTDRGRLLCQNETVLMFGGPLPLTSVNYLESQSLTPVYFKSDSRSNNTHLEFVETATGIAKVDVLASSIDLKHEDYFVIMGVIDKNGNNVFISYGFDGKGTWAAGIFLKSVSPNIQAYTNSYYIFHWNDTNGNGVPQPSEMTLVATG
jgi:hypothetical protein